MSCLRRDQHEQWKHQTEKGSRRYKGHLLLIFHFLVFQIAFLSICLLFLYCLRSIKVFRGQLPRDNQFYSSEAPKNNGSDKPLGSAGMEIFFLIFLEVERGAGQHNV